MYAVDSRTGELVTRRNFSGQEIGSEVRFSPKRGLCGHVLSTGKQVAAQLDLLREKKSTAEKKKKKVTAASTSGNPASSSAEASCKPAEVDILEIFDAEVDAP